MVGFNFDSIESWCRRKAQERLEMAFDRKLYWVGAVEDRLNVTYQRLYEAGGFERAARVAELAERADARFMSLCALPTTYRD